MRKRKMSDFIHLYTSNILLWQLDNFVFFLILFGFLKIIKNLSPIYKKYMILLSFLKTLVPPVIPVKLFPTSEIFHTHQNWMNPIVVTLKHPVASTTFSSVWIWGGIILLVFIFFNIILVRILYRKAEIIKNFEKQKSKAIIVQSRYYHSPFVIGFLKYIIFVPLNFDQWNEQEQSLALKHEFAHIYFHDPDISVFLLVFALLNVLNPLYWLLLIEYRKITEIVADEYVVQSSQWSGDVYAECLLSIREKFLALKSDVFIQTGLFDGFHAIKDRIHYLIKPRKEISMKRKWLIFSMYIIFSLFFIFLACNRESQSEQRIHTNVVQNNIEKELISYGELTKKPELLNRDILTKYPTFLYENQIEGRVVAKIILDENGNVINAKLVKEEFTMPDYSTEKLEKAKRVVLEKVKDLKFTRAMQGDQPVRTSLSIPIQYRLK